MKYGGPPPTGRHLCTMRSHRRRSIGPTHAQRKQQKERRNNNGTPRPNAVPQRKHTHTRTTPLTPKDVPLHRVESTPEPHRVTLNHNRVIQVHHHRRQTLTPPPAHPQQPPHTTNSTFTNPHSSWFLAEPVLNLNRSLSISSATAPATELHLDAVPGLTH